MVLLGKKSHVLLLERVFNLVSWQVLLELAQNRNKIPLPKTIAGPGIPLPPDQDTLTSPNYMFGIPSQGSGEPEETEDEETSIPNPSQEEKTDMQQQDPHQRVSFPTSFHD